MPLVESHKPETKVIAPSEASAAKRNADDNDKAGGLIETKELGLITLSGLPAAHWKNLFHLELVKERNKPKEPPKKPPSAPFFLQWRSGEEIAGAKKDDNVAAIEGSNDEVDDTAWASAWTDDNDAWETDEMGRDSKRDLDAAEPESMRRKRPRVTRYRSELASILEKAYKAPRNHLSMYRAATDHVAKLGPSAIDVELSSLCAGMHDLEEGLPLLGKACDWLLDCCQRRE